MIKLECTVKNPDGVHARPAGCLRALAKEFNCQILLRKDDSDDYCDASNVLSVMTKNFKCGDNVLVQVISKSDKPVNEFEFVTKLKSIFGEKYEDKS